jgi:glycogen(starch) synthase
MNVWLMPSAFLPHLGGVEEVTFQLAQGLKKQGHSVLVLTQRHPAELPAYERISGLDVIRLEFPAPARAFRPALRFPSALVRTQTALFRQLPRPDVVNVHCASAQLGSVIPFVTAKRVPLVLTTHGELDVDADALFQRSVYARSSFRLTARLAKRVTACSRWTANRAARLAPAFEHAVVIPNGVDLEDWPLLPPVRDPIVAAWGRHVRQKGFDLLLNAWPDVRRRVPDAQLLIGGDGTETERLRELATEGVTFVGRLDRGGVKKLLARSKIVVVPSRLEPFGIVALEAMAAGRGVVWSERGGLAEATGGLGWSVDPENRSQLVRALVGALQTEPNGEPFRVRAEELSVNAMTNSYLDVYRLATESPGSR